MVLMVFDDDKGYVVEICGGYVIGGCLRGCNHDNNGIAQV